MSGKCQALLVDLDGVMIDSSAAQTEGWTAWCARHNLRPEPFLGAHGLSAIDKIRTFAPSLNPVVEAQRITDWEVEHLSGVTAADGAEGLWTLGLPWAIVTSAAERLARARLGAAGLPAPEHMIAAEMTERGKPNPEPFLLGAKRLGIAPAHCTVIEDAPSGVAAGVAAGMRVIALTTTVNRDELWGAHVVVDTLALALAWVRAELSAEQG